MTRIEIVETLRERLRQMERTRRPARDAGATERDGLKRDSLDRFLARRGFRRGVLVEWLSRGAGGGAGTLALATAVRVCGRGPLVVVDGRGDFFPPAAAGFGIELANMIVVRPRETRDCIWTLEQSLRCSGVGAVLCWVERLDARSFRRLQIAADSSGVVGVLVRPASAARQPSYAALRLRVEPIAESSRHAPPCRPPHPPRHTECACYSRRVRVEVIRCRGAADGEVVELEIDDATGDVRLAAQLADPATVRRSVRA